MERLHLAREVVLKQGLYRNASIVPDGIVFLDAMIKGETLDDVMPPPP